MNELEPFFLQCTALNLPTPHVSWLKDNALLNEAGSVQLERLSVEQTAHSAYHVVSVLQVQRAEPGVDDGEYQCRIENVDGTGEVVYDTMHIEIKGM